MTKSPNLLDIPTLKVRFEPRIQPRELNAFRGAMAAKVGLEHEWFHNHDNDEKGNRRYHYRYPLVQYRLMGGCPGLFFLGKGADEAMRLFAQPDWSVTYTRQNKVAHLSEMKRAIQQIGLSQKMQLYRLRSWIAFNQDNYKRYQQTPGLIGRLELMERALAGQILGLATGLGYQFPERFSVAITEWEGASTVTFSKNKMLAFNVSFQTDAVLPLQAGLGRGAGRGFGEIEIG